VKQLLTQLRTYRTIFQNSRCYLGFDFQVELVKKVRLGLEVGEQRSIRNASFFRYACRWRTQV
jgi:hypothetical protein